MSTVSGTAKQRTWLKSSEWKTLSSKHAPSPHPIVGRSGKWPCMKYIKALEHVVWCGNGSSWHWNGVIDSLDWNQILKSVSKPAVPAKGKKQDSFGTPCRPGEGFQTNRSVLVKHPSVSKNGFVVICAFSWHLSKMVHLIPCHRLKFFPNQIRSYFRHFDLTIIKKKRHGEVTNVSAKTTTLLAIAPWHQKKFAILLSWEVCHFSQKAYLSITWTDQKYVSDCSVQFVSGVW